MSERTPGQDQEGAVKVEARNEADSVLAEYKNFFTELEHANLPPHLAAPEQLVILRNARKSSDFDSQEKQKAQALLTQFGPQLRFFDDGLRAMFGAYPFTLETFAKFFEKPWFRFFAQTQIWKMTYEVGSQDNNGEQEKVLYFSINLEGELVDHLDRSIEIPPISRVAAIQMLPYFHGAWRNPTDKKARPIDHQSDWKSYFHSREIIHPGTDPYAVVFDQTRLIRDSGTTDYDLWGVMQHSRHAEVVIQLVKRMQSDPQYFREALIDIAYGRCKNLRASGWSRVAAIEAMASDPRLFVDELNDLSQNRDFWDNFSNAAVKVMATDPVLFKDGLVAIFPYYSSSLADRLMEYPDVFEETLRSYREEMAERIEELLIRNRYRKPEWETPSEEISIEIWLERAPRFFKDEIIALARSGIQRAKIFRKIMVKNKDIFSPADLESLKKQRSR